MTRRRSLVAAIGVLCMWSACVLALSGCRPSQSGSAGMSQDSGSDQQLTDFLQKRFRIADPSSITIGPPSPAPISGLWIRPVTIATEQGRANLTIFTDGDQRKFIIGQLMDIAQDPWSRVDVRSLHLDDRPSMGPSEAPVVLIEFADFECPHCARSMDALETIVNSSYRGRVRLVYKYYPLNGHLWARPAAIAAECARLQNPQAFWQFARDFYRDQGGIDPSNLRQHIDDYAASLKLDPDTLHACMLGKSADLRVSQDIEDGAAAQVTSTPALFVNGIPVVGAVDEKSIGFVIDSELHAPQTAR